MSRREWQALEWWERRLYLEGLNQEFSQDGEGAQQEPGSNTQVLNGNPGEMAALGYTEHTL
jgi:hypothetical protein